MSDALALVSGFSKPNAEAEFENILSGRTKWRRALVFSSGRSGLYALINVMGWKQREFILPAYTCAVVANTIIASGNIPRFVDIDIDDFNMSVSGVASALNKNTAAVVATHMYGFPMDLVRVREFVNRLDPNIFIIQDCALAMGNSIEKNDRQTGTEVALYSFSIGKQISTVEGGAIVTDNDELYRELANFRNHSYCEPKLRRVFSQIALFLAAWLGLSPRTYQLIYTLSSRTNILRFITEHFDEYRVTMPSTLLEKIPPQLASLGVNQLARADFLISKRWSNSKFIRRNIRSSDRLLWPEPRNGASFSHCPCLIRDRDDFLQFMSNRGVQIGKEVFDYALPELPVFRPYASVNFRNAVRVAREIALIPNHSNLSEKQILHIVNSVNQWLAV